ncbi:MAG: hypothetical protein IPI93_13445 [Sphingobacteriaceae bacterium]|nr:hypothetical protein [Sphingobacteriaceae bacterium]
MQLIYQLSQLAPYPIPHHMLITMLHNYKRPNDKIHELISKKILLPIKKGLYVTGKTIGSNQVPKELIANLLYGPSYISLDYALSHYNMIPERVVKISSVCNKPSKTITNDLGTFIYNHIPMPYYSYGISEYNNASISCLMASPEKALCDKLVCTNAINPRSVKETIELLVNNWRIDEDALKQLDIKQISTWLKKAPKKTALQFLVKAIKQC